MLSSVETLASSTTTPLSRALPTTHTLSWTRRHAIDAAKRPFSEELVERIKSIIDSAKIDVLICNHIEMDHSGSVPHILELAPNAEVYAAHLRASRSSRLSMARISTSTA